MIKVEKYSGHHTIGMGGVFSHFFEYWDGDISG